MQSEAEEEWDDGDWDDEDESNSSLSFLSNVSLASKMKVAGAVSFVILILMISMVSNNLGFYRGAGNITVLIDVEEAVNAEDRTLNANIWATAPTFGMIAKEGTYSILVNGVQTFTGSFKLNDEGIGSIKIDYAEFFTVNGDYTIKVDIDETSDSDTVNLQKVAENIRGEVAVFDGQYPLDKNDKVLINLQFTTSTQFSDYISPWVSGTVKIYHAEEVFKDNQGESYWDNDGGRNFASVEEIAFTVEGASVYWQYSSGTSDQGVNLWLDPAEFYSDGGSGDYAMTIEFTNDFGTDSELKSGQTFWKWFHLCQTKTNGDCDQNN